MKKYTLFVIVFALLLGLGGVALAGTSNISGWAWSPNIGWISFSSANPTSGGGSYAVTISTTTANPTIGVFGGHAWSAHGGWISFNQADINGCPTEAEDTAVDAVTVVAGATSCTPRMNFQTGKVNGWGRFMTLKDYPTANAGGWLHLSGTNHTSSGPGVSFGTDGRLTGYAWSPEYGWIDIAAIGPGGDNGVIICTGSECPAEPITGTCTINGQVGGIVDHEPGDQVTLAVESITGGNPPLVGGVPTYARYEWYDGNGHYANTTTGIYSGFTYNEGDTDPGALYYPVEVTVYDIAGSGARSGVIDCGSVSMEGNPSTSADLKLWIGDATPDCLGGDASTPACKKVTTRVNPGKPVTVSWASQGTDRCVAQTLLNPPGAIGLPGNWDLFEVGIAGSDDIILTTVGTYTFAMQCDKPDMSQIPNNVTDTTYGGAPIQNKINIQVTNAVIEEI